MISFFEFFCVPYWLMNIDNFECTCIWTLELIALNFALIHTLVHVPVYILNLHLKNLCFYSVAQQFLISFFEFFCVPYWLMNIDNFECTCIWTWSVLYQLSRIMARMATHTYYTVMCKWFKACYLVKILTCLVYNWYNTLHVQMHVHSKLSIFMSQ
jgi:hypothetical protein